MTTEEKILALLEVIAYQGSSRGQEIDAYLEGVYQRYRERNPADDATGHEDAA